MKAALALLGLVVLTACRTPEPAPVPAPPLAPPSTNNVIPMPPVNYSLLTQ